MQNPKRILHWVVAGFILFNLVLLYLVLQPRETPPVLLPNGSSIKILGTSYGTNHFCGTMLARAVNRAPPAVQLFLKRIFGPKALPVHQVSTPQPGLIIFYEILRTNAVPPPPFAFRYALKDLVVMLANRDGILSGEAVNIPLTVADAPKKNWIAFNSFPRRHRTFDVAFLPQQSSPTQSIARVTLPNPLYIESPTWQPEPLPATRHSGDFDFTLQTFESVTTNLLFPMPTYIQFPLETNPFLRQSCYAFRLKANLPNRQAQYQLTAVKVDDATGNSESASGDVNTRPLRPWGAWQNLWLNRVFHTVVEPDNTLHCILAPSLWPDESAWKLTLTIESYLMSGDKMDDANHTLEFVVKPRP